MKNSGAIDETSLADKVRMTMGENTFERHDDKIKESFLMWFGIKHPLVKHRRVCVRPRKLQPSVQKTAFASNCCLSQRVKRWQNTIITTFVAREYYSSFPVCNYKTSRTRKDIFSIAAHPKKCVFIFVLCRVPAIASAERRTDNRGRKYIKSCGSGERLMCFNMVAQRRQKAPTSTRGALWYVMGASTHP